MAEKFRFFDPVLLPDGTYDREYNAQEFTDYFAALVTTGVMKGAGNELKVTTSGSSMVTTVDTGIAFILGRYYENDSILTLTHDTEVLGKNRIDRIVVRLDLNTDKRYVKAFIKKGVASSSPVPPSLQRDNLVYEISLAQVKIIGGQTYINPGDITDERGTEDICPWAGSKILPNFDNAALEQLINDFNSLAANYYSLTDGINVKDRTTIDFNTITDTGFYWGNTFWGASNLPVSNVTFIVHVYRAGGYSGGPCVQVAYQADSNAGGKIYKRVRISGTWGQWEEIGASPIIDSGTGWYSVFVSPSGSDTTGDGTIGKPYKTIMKAINSIKKFGQGLGREIILADGTYDEKVTIKDFHGSLIRLSGYDATKAFVTKKIEVIRCTCRVEITQLSANNTTSYEDAIYIQDCPDVFINNVNMTANTKSTNGSGVTASNSKFTVLTATISNKDVAIKCLEGSYGRVLSVSGSGNNNGLVADASILFDVTGNTISATTRIVESRGGQVWP